VKRREFIRAVAVLPVVFGVSSLGSTVSASGPDDRVHRLMRELRAAFYAKHGRHPRKYVLGYNAAYQYEHYLVTHERVQMKGAPSLPKGQFNFGLAEVHWSADVPTWSVRVAH
jgi:hypothetical protein